MIWTRKLFYLEILDKVRKNKRLFSLMLFFDVLLMLSVVLLNIIITFFMPNSYEKIAGIFENPLSLIFFTLAYAFIYFAIVLLIYSFFKYCILDFINSVFNKKKFTIKRLFSFYLLNIRAVVVPIILSFIILMLISLVFQRRYASDIFILIVIPIIFFYYPFVNLCHSMFYYNEKNPIRKSLRVAFRPGKWYRIYLSSILIIIVYIIITLAVTAFAKYTFFSSEEFFHNYYDLYQNTYNIITFAFVILLNAVNRIAWYKIILPK